MAAPHDLRGHFRVPADGVADHERGHLDAVAVKQVQDPGHALTRPVLIEAVLPQIGKARQDLLADWAASAADRLATGLELHGYAHRQSGTARPKPLALRHRCSPSPVRVHPPFG